MTDYLTCGQCLREFPLQRITLFIQHKKLDCDDADDVQLDNPELQCIYCPQGFMTAWGLLVHSQLTHNLKIFLEKASKSLLNQKQTPSLQQHGPLSSGKVFSKQNNYPVQDADNSVNTEIQPILSNVVHKTERNFSPESCKQSKSIGIIHSQVHKQCIVTERNIPKEDSNKENHNLAKMGSGIMVTRDINSGTKHVRERVTADENILEASSDNTANSISSFASSNISHVSASNAVNVFNQFAQTSTQSITPEEKDLNVINENIATQIPTLSSSVTLVNISKTPGKVLTLKSLSPQKPLQIGQSRTDSLPTLPNLIKETSDMLVSRTADNMTAKQCTAIYSMSAGEKMGSVTFVELPTLGTDQMDINGIMVNQIQERIESVEMPRDKNESSILTCPAERVDTGRGEEEDPENATNRENTCLENESLDSAMEECCDNQGCGVTVIPGSHQNLQKCCNAIVPKKRKRHMEMKHMPPFSWSSSRYARRKMLQRSLAASATKSLSSAFLRKVSGGNIYIDLEPESLMVAGKPQNSDFQQGAEVDAPQCKADIKSTSPQSLQAENILNEPENRSRSLILQSGAVFSIPFTYKIPNSLTGSRSTRIAQAVSVADTTIISQNVTPLTSQSSTTSADENPDRVVQMPEYTTIFSKTENESEIRRRKYPTSKPFRCGMCSLSFNQRIHLKKHMSKHTGVKPYKCGECNYSTVERSHLKVHIRIHTGEKPFKCTYCEYATAQNSTLKIHLKRHHGGRMFQCNDCDKKFTQEQQLKGHEWEHGKVIISHDKQKNEADVAAWHTAGDKAIAIMKDNSSVIMNSTNQIDDSIHVIPPIPGVSSTNQGKDNGIVSSMESMTNQDRDIGHVISLPEKVDQSDQRVAYYTSLASKLLQGENWSESGEKR